MADVRYLIERKKYNKLVSKAFAATKTAFGEVNTKLSQREHTQNPATPDENRRLSKANKPTKPTKRDELNADSTLPHLQKSTTSSQERLSKTINFTKNLFHHTKTKLSHHTQQLQSHPTIQNIFSNRPTRPLVLKEYDCLESSLATAKTVLFLGETGAGKSQLINAVLNHYLSVKWGDDERFYVVSPRQTSSSDTKRVKFYCLEPNWRFPDGLTLIDTPGFGDTGGVLVEEGIKEQLFQLLTTSLRKVDMICYVESAGKSRLTDERKYVLDCVFQMFGKEAEKNLQLMFTFADAGEPKSLHGMMEAGFEVKKWFKFNNSALFERSLADPSALKMEKIYWSMNQSQMELWFETLLKNDPLCLSDTRQVLFSRKNMNVQLKKLRQLTEELSLNQESSIQTASSISGARNRMARNKARAIRRVVQKFTQVELPPGVVHCV
mmetsp:Transcript_30571/g.34762  ORF Transcript_30571/g.34762 Transcript_30571/m.34762 type:complete len:437 (+) Transcript_30571:71-1381(+)